MAITPVEQYKNVYLHWPIKIMKISWTHIQDTDSYSDADSTKHDFDPSNKTLNDY